MKFTFEQGPLTGDLELPEEIHHLTLIARGRLSIPTVQDSKIPMIVIRYDRVGDSPVMRFVPRAGDRRTINEILNVERPW